MGGSHETKQTSEQSLNTVLRAAHLIFTGAMCRYMKDICDEQVSEASKCNKDGSDMQLLYSYPTAPTISVKCWEDVQSMDAFPVVYAQIPPAMDVGEYNDELSEIEQAYQAAYPDFGSSVPVAAVLLYNGKSRTLLCLTAARGQGHEL